MKKMHLALSAAITLALFSSVASYAGEVDLVPGATVVADEASPSGYTTTFVYEDAEAESVNLMGTFGFHTEGGQVGILPEEYISGKDYVPGLFRCSNSDTAITEPMEKVEGTDYWTVSLYLPSGRYLYNYNVNGSEETFPDPANPPMESTAQAGGSIHLSTVMVPYDEKQGTSLNFDFLLPNEEAAGELTYADYTDINGNLAGLAIYLPFGYDADREEPYPTLYLSHGFGGSEMEWFASGATNYLFDNLIAEGKVEPTVVVTMNNTNYIWDFDVIEKNVMNCILPFMEENYNVSAEPKGRAFGGLSMGGMTTSHMYYDDATNFGYFGIFSGADSRVNIQFLDQEALNTPTIMVGAGCYDFALDPHFGMGYFALQQFVSQMGAEHIPFDYYVVKGGHDWSVWPQLLKIFAENYLWR